MLSFEPDALLNYSSVISLSFEATRCGVVFDDLLSSVGVAYWQQGCQVDCPYKWQCRMSNVVISSFRHFVISSFRHFVISSFRRVSMVNRLYVNVAGKVFCFALVEVEICSRQCGGH